MSTKYGSQIPARKRWQHTGRDRPRLSDHLVGGLSEDGPGRWLERTPPDAPSPETAWEEGIDVAESILPWFDGENQPSPDRVRFYAEDSDFVGRWMIGILVLIQDDDQIAYTAIRCDEWDDPAQRSYCYARAEEVIQS